MAQRSNARSLAALRPPARANSALSECLGIAPPPIPRMSFFITGETLSRSAGVELATAQGPLSTRRGGGLLPSRPRRTRLQGCASFPSSAHGATRLKPSDRSHAHSRKFFQERICCAAGELSWRASPIEWGQRRRTAFHKRATRKGSPSKNSATPGASRHGPQTLQAARGVKSAFPQARRLRVIKSQWRAATRFIVRSGNSPFSTLSHAAALRRRVGPRSLETETILSAQR